MDIDQAFRWAQVWWFLSLHTTDTLARPLWLEEFDSGWLEYIRAARAPSEGPTAHVDPRPRVYAKLRGFSNQFGPNALEYLQWWARAVYGSDDYRSSEFLWSMAIYTAQAHLKEYHDVADALAVMRQRYGEASMMFDDELARIR